MSSFVRFSAAEISIAVFERGDRKVFNKKSFVSPVIFKVDCFPVRLREKLLLSLLRHLLLPQVLQILSRSAGYAIVWPQDVLERLPGGVLKMQAAVH